MGANAHLTDVVKTIRVENAVAAGTSDVTTDAVDTRGYDGARFIWLLGDVTNAATLQAVLYNDSNSDASGGTAEVTGTAITAGATDYDNKLLIVDAYRPNQRYVYSVLDRGAQNAVVDGCICELYRVRTAGITQDSTVGDTAKG